jgi:ABC-type multidrug transport system permease subunit
MLLCLFHVRQSWKNKLNELLGSKGTPQIICLRKQVKQYIKGILNQLKIMDSAEEMKKYVENSEQVFQVFIYIIYEITLIFILIYLQFILYFFLDQIKCCKKYQ